jgi:hypothetical protein
MRFAKAGPVMLLAATIGVAVVIGTLAQSSAPPSGRGETWSSWTHTERQLFVAAYLDGYLRGKTDACVGASELFELDKPASDLADTADQKCFRHAKSYSRTANEYVSTIDSFYAKDGKYEDVPIEYLMLLFTDPRYQTSADVQAEIQKHGWPSRN